MPNDDRMTWKPCPGCGYKPQGHTLYRRANDVCGTCRSKLDGFKRMQDAISKDGARLKRFNLESGYWSAMRDLYFGVRSDVDRGCRDGRNPSDNLQRHMYQLYQACSVDANPRAEDSGIPDYVEHWRRFHCGSREMRITIWRKLERLRRSIGRALDESYNSGFENGNDLLRNLADGKVSVDDYNQRQ